MWLPRSKTGLVFGTSILLFFCGCAKKPAAPPDGAALFASKCETCHRVDSETKAPLPDALRQMSRSAILSALQTGRMKWEGRLLSKAQRSAIADYLGTPDIPVLAQMKGYCARDLDPPADPPVWNAWGADAQNSRFQAAKAAGLSAQQVQGLKLKWAFGFPNAAATYGQPASFAGRLFVGSEDGTVYALDAATGCTWWTFHASATVKTVVSVGNKGQAAFFGDTNGTIYAVKASDGSLIWTMRPESHPAARITGSPLLVGNRLFVPVSSGEEGAAADPKYPCCTFRGSVVAVDTVTGKPIWKAYTIAATPKMIRKTASGVQFWGPSGAAVWSAPTADLKRRAIYVATGNNYSDPPTDTSDAVLAFDMDSGRLLWSRQFTGRDSWNIGCVAEQKNNCPEPHGSDFDFGAAPMLRTLPNGKQLLLLAQKSGVVYAVDPDRRGELIWQKRLGHGGPLGGIQWGGAGDRRYAYFPLSDYDDTNPLMGGGLFALDLRTGQPVWYTPPVKPACLGQFGCSSAQMAPPTAIPGVIFSGSLDGHLRAYDSADGTLLWDFDTAKKFDTVNGIPAHGGSLNGGGPTIVGGMLYVNAGYTNAMGGNVLLAFSVDGK